MKNTLAITLLSSCALLLGACTTDYQKSQAAPAPTGSEFTRDLSNHYRGMAENQWEGQRDFTGSERFARKSMAAGRGEAVAPDAIVHNVPVKLEPELVTARERLITAFNNGATTRSPVAAARAQAAFDCWLDEASDPVQGVEGAWLEAKVQNCRDTYYTSLNQIDAARPVAAAPAPVAPVAAAPTPRQQSYITFFDFDQSTVTTAGQAVLKGVSDNVRRGGVVDVTVTGNADRSGSDGYNLSLSKRRAEAVKAILVRDGVSPNLIVMLAKGETQPLVATADGMREPQNRNVAVYIK
jgi:OmpA-OmpF porin, OOP family